MSEINLVPTLLQAIVSIDGEALVMHAGDKPYVVSSSGQVELASRGLTLDAASGIVAQLLPPEFQHALHEFGAVHYTLQPQAEFPEEQFTVVVAIGGDDVWAEIHRKRVSVDDVPEELLIPPVSAPPAADLVGLDSVGSGMPLPAQPGIVNRGPLPPEAVHVRPGDTSHGTRGDGDGEVVVLTATHRDSARQRVPDRRTPAATPIPQAPLAPLPPAPPAAVAAPPAAPARSAPPPVRLVAPPAPPAVIFASVRPTPPTEEPLPPPAPRLASPARWCCPSRAT